MNTVPESARPFSKGMLAMGMFLFFGASMAFFAGITLVWHGTPLDRLWELNPRAYQQLGPLGKIAGIPFLFLGYALTVAGVSWFKRQYLGWQLAVAIIALQAAGDMVNMIRGQIFAGLTGVVIACTLLYYLLRPSVRGAFKQYLAKKV